MEDSGKVVLGVLAGIAIGATLGILFAPDKGEETRKKIIAKSGEIEDDLEKEFNDFMKEMKRKYDKLKEDAAKAAHEDKQHAPIG